MLTFLTGHKVKSKIKFSIAVLLITFLNGFAGSDLQESSLAITRGEFDKAIEIVKNSSDEDISKVEGLLSQYNKLTE